MYVQYIQILVCVLPWLLHICFIWGICQENPEACTSTYSAYKYCYVYCLGCYIHAIYGGFVKKTLRHVRTVHSKTGTYVCVLPWLLHTVYALSGGFVKKILRHVRVRTVHINNVMCTALAATYKLYTGDL
jgi:hypothetical protein